MKLLFHKSPGTEEKGRTTARREQGKFIIYRTVSSPCDYSTT